jgi:hypothetical protein
MIANRFEPLAFEPGGIKARDLETAQTVILRDVVGLDQRLVGIFHPALVSIFAIASHHGRDLAATEAVQARTLAELFADVPCHPKRAAEIVSEIADGVAELHAREVCHGQIDLRSTMLTAKGKAKLALASARSGTQEGDLKALKLLLCEIGGRLTPDSAGAQSAAVFAALLRRP